MGSGIEHYVLPDGRGSVRVVQIAIESELQHPRARDAEHGHQLPDIMGDRPEVLSNQGEG